MNDDLGLILNDNDNDDTIMGRPVLFSPRHSRVTTKRSVFRRGPRSAVWYWVPTSIVLGTVCPKKKNRRWKDCLRHQDQLTSGNNWYAVSGGTKYGIRHERDPTTTSSWKRFIFIRFFGLFGWNCDESAWRPSALFSFQHYILLQPSNEGTRRLVVTIYRVSDVLRDTNLPTAPCHYPVAASFHFISSCCKSASQMDTLPSEMTASSRTRDTTARKSICAIVGMSAIIIIIIIVVGGGGGISSSSSSSAGYHPTSQSLRDGRDLNRRVDGHSDNEGSYLSHFL
eukprot:scaffold3221_cov194-Amphora_coffeaeformis.AAC.6